jgi:hypothetical protein
MMSVAMIPACFHGRADALRHEGKANENITQVGSIDVYTFCVPVSGTLVRLPMDEVCFTLYSFQDPEYN